MFAGSELSNANCSGWLFGAGGGDIVENSPSKGSFIYPSAFVGSNKERLGLFTPEDGEDTALFPPTRTHPLLSPASSRSSIGCIQTSPLGKTTLRRPQYLDHVWQSISSSCTWAVLAPVVGDMSKVVRLVRERRTGESAVRRAC